MVDFKSRITIPRLVAGYAAWKKSIEKDFSMEFIPYLGVRYFNIHLQSEVFNSTNMIDVQLGVSMIRRYHYGIIANEKLESTIRFIGPSAEIGFRF